MCVCALFRLRAHVGTHCGCCGRNWLLSCCSLSLVSRAVAEVRPWSTRYVRVHTFPALFVVAVALVVCMLTYLHLMREEIIEMNRAAARGGSPIMEGPCVHIRVPGELAAAPTRMLRKKEYCCVVNALVVRFPLTQVKQPPSSFP